MTINNLKIAFRNLWRNRVFSSINMLGLVLGFCVFLLISEYLAFEWGSNRFHQNINRLYRLSFLYTNKASNYYMPPGLAPAITGNIPGVSQCVRMGEDVGNGVVSVNMPASKKVFRENHVSFTDGQFFKAFSFPVLQGSGLLTASQTAAVSQSTALRYFGHENAVGKVIQVNNQFGNTNYTITTVYQDMPQNSDIKADMLLSFKTLENPAFRNENDWADPNSVGSEYCFIYVLASEQAAQQMLTRQLTQQLRRLKPDAKTDILDLQPLKYLHLAPSLDYRFQTFGSTLLAISFLSVSVLIMLIAWVNYANLTTAQALNRSKDVGIRKVLGASRWQLTGQYLTETTLLTLMSVMTALLMVLLLQKPYNSFLGKSLSLSLLNTGAFWLIGLLLVAIGVIIAGGYAAWVLGSFNPLKTIRSKAMLQVGGISLRRSMVVFQFSISTVFIIATIVLYQQLHYMQNQDLGMQTTQRMVVTGPSVINSSQITQSLAFENEVRQLPFVERLAASNNVPGQGYNFSTAGITNSNPSQGDEKKSYAMLIVDDQYFNTYDIKLKQGAFFTPPMLEHGWPKTKKVVLNETAARQLGYNVETNIIGQKIKWQSEFEIVGVVKDYHHLGLREQIRPVIFLPAVADGFFTIKMRTQNMPQHVAAVQQIYHRIFPGEPFTYIFSDEVYAKQYNADTQLGKMFMAGASIAVLIACLGLLGLAMISANQRVKELGIRKVLGASWLSLVNLVSADFLKLVSMALVIASPVAWFIAHRWLQDFAYHINIQWWMFALAGVLALFIAFITVGTQALKAANANPVKSLRSE